MLFNSFEFLIFLPIVFILYWFVFNKKLSRQNGLLLISSYYFYGWWSLKFMGLLMLITLLDYFYGFWVASSNRKKARLFLWLSVINNLGILAIFKYYNFFAIQFQNSFELLGIHTNAILLDLALPIGISFYTFHGMSYIFDIYRKQQTPIKNLVDYAVFVSFFPLLVAGPIERANHLLPQIQQPRLFNYGRMVEGCRLILWGLFKKVVIADSLANIVNPIFLNYELLDSTTLIVGAIAFSFQIYCDFSGYSDIAIGTAKLFGFELLSNFRFPYFARDVAEFWRRWHISLSSWFRDYLYIPLGGSKDGKLKAIRNTFIIFLVSGFWHGASWNFIAWGFIHACGFLPLLLLGRNRKHREDIVASKRAFPNLKELWQMSTTFIFVTFTWIFFRSEGIPNALDYIKNIFIAHQGQSPTPVNSTIAFIYILPLILIDWWLRRDERHLRIPFNNKLKHIAYFVILSLTLVYLMIEILLKNKPEFIYFQF